MAGPEAPEGGPDQSWKSSCEVYEVGRERAKPLLREEGCGASWGEAVGPGVKVHVGRGCRPRNGPRGQRDRELSQEGLVDNTAGPQRPRKA